MVVRGDQKGKMKASPPWMKHTSTSTKLRDEFMQKYSKSQDFKITGRGPMKTVLDMEIEQDIQQPNCI
jgi:hypothetical protein